MTTVGVLSSEMFCDFGEAQAGVEGGGMKLALDLA
jgi:hypothetical protein